MADSPEFVCTLPAIDIPLAGDSFHIPEGVPHSGVASAGYQADRYTARD